MLPNASEFLAINANLLKIAFGRAFAREIRYMGEQYYEHRNSIEFMLPNPYECLAIVTNVLQLIRIVYDYFTDV